MFELGAFWLDFDVCMKVLGKERLRAWNFEFFHFNKLYFKDCAKTYRTRFLRHKIIQLSQFHCHFMAKKEKSLLSYILLQVCFRLEEVWFPICSISLFRFTHYLVVDLFQLNIKSHQVTKRFPMGVGISRKSMVGFGIHNGRYKL